MSGYVYAIAFSGEQTLFAATSSRIFVSSNNGDSWSSAGAGGLGNTFILALALHPQGYVVAGTYPGGAYLYKHQVGKFVEYRNEVLIR